MPSHYTVNSDDNNPYAAPQTSAGLENKFHDLEGIKAARATRLFAALIDAAIYVATLTPIAFAHVFPGESAEPNLTLLGTCILAFFAVFIYNLVLLYKSSQTIGKALMNIRIVRTDGSNASLGRIFGLRMLMPGLISAIPFLGSVFSIVDVLWIFGAERRCLHDLIADTIVVQKID